MNDDFARAERALNLVWIALLASALAVELALERFRFARQVREAELALRDVDADQLEPAPES